MAKPKALILEGFTPLAELVAASLQTMGYDTKIIYNHQQASSWIVEHDPDLILLSLYLPGLPEESPLQQIKQSIRNPQTKTIIFNGDDVLINRNKEQVDYILRQPVTYEKLTGFSTH